MEMLTTLGAAAAGLLAGALWCDALVRPLALARGRPRMTFARGFGEASAPLAVVAALLAALLLRHLFGVHGVTEPLDGALWGAAIGAGVMAPWALAAAVAGRHAAWWGDVGAAAAALAATGAVLTA
jgi:hypothetical protein